MRSPSSLVHRMGQGTRLISLTLALLPLLKRYTQHLGSGAAVISWQYDNIIFTILTLTLALTCISVVRFMLTGVKGYTKCIHTHLVVTFYKKSV